MVDIAELPLPEPNPKFLDGQTPTIVWAGKKWPIPLLAPRENRFVIPALMRSRQALSKLNTPGAPPLTEQEMDDMNVIIFFGLKRAHPALTRDQYDNVAFRLDDLMEAMPVVADQTGAMKKAAATGDGDSATQGEATAAPQTGTQ